VIPEPLEVAVKVALIDKAGFLGNFGWWSALR